MIKIIFKPAPAKVNSSDVAFGGPILGPDFYLRWRVW